MSLLPLPSAATSVRVGNDAGWKLVFRHDDRSGPEWSPSSASACSRC